MPITIPRHTQPAARGAAPLCRVLLLGLLAGCATAQPSTTPAPMPAAAPAATPATAPIAAPAPPPLQREFRGAWVASVANIDWPSRPGLSTAEQKAELLGILDRAVELRLNAVILQVRPGADALYASRYEPWSEFLTGEMGRAPEPFYDPLEFAVSEAHRRGLELHAWFNPYRARHPSARSAVSADHISRTRPEIVRRYGSYLWMDPGEPEVQEHSLRVMLDVVRRYDVDGIHLDDYFYPYPEVDAAKRPIPFPDERSWQRYRSAGGTLARDDWRRKNVDDFIERLYREVKAEKPWVKVGISPFGIWRPGNPPQVAGFDQYAQLYADARKWLVNGWLDYFTPQLYWPIAQTQQSYPVLLRWWVEQNPMGRHIWPGNYTSRVQSGATPRWPAREVLEQIDVTRGQPGATGNVHFSMRSLMSDPDSLATRLVREAYAEPALPPASPWLGQERPAAPSVRIVAADAATLQLGLMPQDGTQPFWWVVRVEGAQGWTQHVVPGGERSVTLPAANGALRRVVVSAVDRTGNEGPQSTVDAGG